MKVNFLNQKTKYYKIMVRMINKKKNSLKVDIYFKIKVCL